MTMTISKPAKGTVDFYTIKGWYIEIRFNERDHQYTVQIGESVYNDLYTLKEVKNFISKYIKG